MEGNEEIIPNGWIKTYSKSQNRYYYFNETQRRSVWDLEDISESQEVLNRRPRLMSSDNVSSEPFQSENYKPAQIIDTTMNKSSEFLNNSTLPKTPQTRKNSAPPGINVAIIVPYREQEEHRRENQLKLFTDYMNKYLSSLKLIKRFHIFVIEQNKGNKFNKGKLFNCGFKIALKHKIDFDSFIFHSIDMLPNKNISRFYEIKPSTVIHIGRCFERFKEVSLYYGGVIAFNRTDFEIIDGYPNNFWGWCCGNCDEELYNRIKHERIYFKSAPYSNNTKEDNFEDLEEFNLIEKSHVLKKYPHMRCENISDVKEELKMIRKSNKYPPWWGVSNAFYIELSIIYISSNCTKYEIDIGDNVDEDGSIHVPPKHHKNNFNKQHNYYSHGQGQGYHKKMKHAHHQYKRQDQQF